MVLISHLNSTIKDPISFCLASLPPSLCWLFVLMLVYPYDINVAAVAPHITSAFKERRRDGTNGISSHNQEIRNL